MSNLSHDSIEYILKTLSVKLSDKFIITGSFADFFHIEYQEINDIDIYLIENDYNLCKNNIINDDNFILLKKFTGIKTNVGNSLYKFLYEKNYMIDITTIDPETYGWRFGTTRLKKLDEIYITKVNFRNQTYKIFSPLVRYHQLSSHNYTRLNPNYESKVSKANIRANKYKEKFKIIDA